MSPYGLHGRIVLLGIALALAGLFSPGAAQSPGGNVIVYLDPMTTAGVGGTVSLAPNGPETKLEVTLRPGDTTSDGRA